MTNKYKILAIAFSVLAFGTLSELSRILTSSAPDIAENRGQLTIMGFVFSGLLIFSCITKLDKV